MKQSLLSWGGKWACAGLCAGVLSVSAVGQEIAILDGESGHNFEYEDPIKTLGWNARHFACSEEGLTRFANTSGNFDMAMVVPLFNFRMKGERGLEILPKEDSAYFARIRKYLKDGGAIVITDGNYSNVRNWLARLDPVFETGSPSECTSSPWQVFDYIRNVEPVHPIRSFPNVIREGDTWSHFPKLTGDSKWKVLANCSEGYPTCLYQEYGKGFVLLTLTRNTYFQPLENYYAYCVLHRANVNVVKSDFTELKPGPGHLRLELEKDAPRGTGISYEIMDAKGKSQVFTTNFVGKVCNLEYVVDRRGPVVATLTLELPTGSVRIFRRKAELPELFTVRPNSYKGILSTKRRTDTVDFLCEFAPCEEDLTGATVNLVFRDEPGNKVLEHSFTLPTNEVPARLWVPVALPRDLAASKYTLEGTLTKRSPERKNRVSAKSATTFEIVAPNRAQTVLDEDGTFLINGVPFFPLGIYHSAGDYDQIADIGFTACQFWKWQLGGDGFGDFLGLNKARGNNLKCLFESNHGGEAVWRQNVEFMKDNPGVFMWYAGDEPHEGAEPGMRDFYNMMLELDRTRPLYICSCRPDLFPVHKKYCDVLAFNPSGHKAQSPMEYLGVITNWIDRAKVATENRQTLMLVNWILTEDQPFEQMRARAYVGITHDVRGLMWYCWSQTGGGPVGIGLKQQPKNQESLKKILAEIKVFLPALVSTGRRTFEEGPIHGIALPNNPAKKRFVIMQNISDRKVTADFVIPELVKAKEVFDAFTDKPVDIKDGRITMTFSPFDRLVLKW